MRRTLAVIALAATACQATPPATPTAGQPSAAPPSTSATPTGAPTAAASFAPVPEGRILFQRLGANGVEHYFTIKTDGTEEHAVFDAEACGCAHWMADGLHVMTLSDTGHGTWSLTTYLFDGSEKTMPDNPIDTLNLAPWPTTADGGLIAFNGWDETVRANTGLWVGSPDLADLRLVLPVQEGMLAIEPFGISPDRSRIVFFAETGPDGSTTHAGDNYVVNADGSGLRKLNPDGTKTGLIGAPTISLSPDGSAAAFGIGDTVYVVDLDGGPARPITEQVRVRLGCLVVAHRGVDRLHATARGDLRGLARPPRWDGGPRDHPERRIR